MFFILISIFGFSTSSQRDELDFFIWTIKTYEGMAGSGFTQVLLSKRSTQILDEFMRNKSRDCGARVIAW